MGVGTDQAPPFQQDTGALQNSLRESTTMQNNIEQKQAELRERNEARGRKLSTLKLSRREALNQLAEAIERLPEDDPQKAVMLRSYLNQKGRRRTNRTAKATKESAVRSAIRKGDVLEVLDQNDCEAYARMSPERRRAMRILYAREEVRHQRGNPVYQNLPNHEGWGGQTRPEELATAILVEDGKLSPTGLGVNFHNEEYVIYPTKDEASEAINAHIAGCYICQSDPRRSFYFDEIFPEAAQ
jgi:hypothetical protein